MERLYVIGDEFMHELLAAEFEASGKRMVKLMAAVTAEHRFIMVHALQEEHIGNAEMWHSPSSKKCSGAKLCSLHC